MAGKGINIKVIQNILPLQKISAYTAQNPVREKF
jgi:hypothetical protein